MLVHDCFVALELSHRTEGSTDTAVKFRTKATAAAGLAIEQRAPIKAACSVQVDDGIIAAGAGNEATTVACHQVELPGHRAVGAYRDCSAALGLCPICVQDVQGESA